MPDMDVPETKIGESEEKCGNGKEEPEEECSEQNTVKPIIYRKHRLSPCRTGLRYSVGSLTSLCY
jgi:hypothetical protein